MNSLLEMTGVAGASVSPFLLEKAATGLLLAFVLGQLAAWVYMYTHAGLSYSRTFVQSIVLLTMIVSLAMMVIGSNIIVAFGLIGALSVIRFRNILKDTRDTAFIFFALVVGMATGTGSYSLAVFGTVLFCLVLLYLHWSYFGSRHTGDGFVRFQIEAKQVGRDALHAVFTRYCRSTHLVSQRFQEGGRGEIAYRLTMRDPARADQLVNELQHTASVSHVSFVLHEEQAEV